MKYRKKPVVIEAVEFDNNKLGICQFIHVNGGEFYTDTDGELYIKTLEGNMHVSPGDFVIKGVQGELYPCKPDIFEKTYEPVD